MPYRSDPLYQRRMARLARLRPEDLAIVQGVVNSTAFADSDMKRYLRDLEIKNKGRYQEENLRQSEEKIGLMRSDSEFSKRKTFDAISAKEKEIRRSRVPGILNVGLSGLSAYNTLRKSKESRDQIGYLVDMQKELTGLYSGLSKRFANTEVDPTKEPDEQLKKRRRLQGV